MENIHFEELKAGDLFCYRSYYVGFGEEWGIFLEFQDTGLVSMKNPNNRIYEIRYFNFQKNYCDFLIVNQNEIRVLDLNDDICKEFFENNSIKKYLTHHEELVRNWAKDALDR